MAKPRVVWVVAVSKLRTVVAFDHDKSQMAVKGGRVVARVASYAEAEKFIRSGWGFCSDRYGYPFNAGILVKRCYGSSGAV